MKIQLTAYEARVIGCLLEKQVTTPEQYPLSLNGLTTACNQKTNRDPVLELSDSDVQNVLDDLLKKRLIRDLSGFGHRVAKYEHRFCNSEFGHLKLNPQEFALICTLLLRGPQTAGELRTRTQRLAEFSDVQAVEVVLEKLATRDDGPYVVQLPREAGKRESRYMHLFCGEVSAAETSFVRDSQGEQPASNQSESARITQLEEDVAALQQRVSTLETMLHRVLSGDNSTLAS
ncbi:MAG: YceH family protein [Plesiomonas sp.]|uniref:YceH family protein n=1 Tax=Plesiomonas sp. TaxID=2486279 RepID=UPI003EE63EF0